MAKMAVVIESAPVASSGRRQPRLAIRGRKRKMVKKLHDAIKSVLDADYREMIRGGTLGYTPYMFTGTWGSQLEKRMTLIKEECEAQLADRIP